VIDAGLRFRRPSLHLIFCFFCFLVSMLLSSCYLSLLCSFLRLLDVYPGILSMSTACQLSMRYHSEAFHPPFRDSQASPLDIIGERLHSIVPCPHGVYQNGVRLIFFSKSNDVYSYYLFRDQPTGTSASGREAELQPRFSNQACPTSSGGRSMLKTPTPKKQQEKKRRSLQVEAPCSFATTQTKQKRCTLRKIIQVYTTTRSLPTPAPRRSNKGTQDHVRTTCSELARGKCLIFLIVRSVQY
jgi:hypothetical protein